MYGWLHTYSPLCGHYVNPPSPPRALCGPCLCSCLLAYSATSQAKYTPYLPPLPLSTNPNAAPMN
jgi:hypothetical protein